MYARSYLPLIHSAQRQTLASTIHDVYRGDLDQARSLRYIAHIVPLTYGRIICASKRFLRKHVTKYLCTSVIRKTLAMKLEIVVQSDIR